MSHVALEMVSILARNTVWLSAAAILSLIVLRITRATWPAAHRAAWILTLAVGWIVWQWSVAVPWYDVAPQPADVVMAEPPDEPAIETESVDVVELATRTGESATTDPVPTDAVATAAAPIEPMPIMAAQAESSNESAARNVRRRRGDRPRDRCARRRFVERCAAHQ